MAVLPFLLLLLGQAVFSQLTLKLDQSTGSYSLYMNGTLWLSSNATALRSGSQWLSTQDGTLHADSTPRTISGLDPTFGPYTGYQLSFNAGLAVLTIKELASLAGSSGAIIFEQYFPNGLSGCAKHSGNPAADSFDISSAWPSFTLPAPASDPALMVASWAGGDDWPMPSQVGVFDALHINASAFGLMGSAAAIYDSSLQVLAITPLDNFMTTHMAVGSSLGTGALGLGLSARVTSVPPSFRSRSLLVGGQGINNTMFALGSALLALSGKARLSVSAATDPSTRFISLWTDNGAFYYYKTEPNATYQQTVIDSVAYTTALSAPIRTLQFDSWWYPKDAAGGCVAWEPMHSIFPDGMNPHWVPLPLVLHSRYFSSKSVYVNNYTFLVDGSMSAPIDVAFFDHIMGLAARWGMVTYEQDWLITVFRGVREIQENITAADTWLDAMNTAAENLGLTIQYCMALPRFLLKSTQLPAVTNARASADYSPSRSVNDNWRIGFSSLLHWSVGLQPSKDNFWSTEIQTNCPYGSGTQCYEHNSFLQALVATLSTGPVSPGDKIGGSNVSLLMSTCRAGDGLILKPDRPATLMDLAFSLAAEQAAAHARAADTAAAPVSVPLVELTHTWSAHGDGRAWRWHYVLAANLTAPVTIHAQDLGPALAAEARGYLAFDYFAIQHGGSGVALNNASQPLAVPTSSAQPSAPAGAIPLSYYIIAPITPSGYTLLGECGKMVPMSGLRSLEFALLPDGFSVVVEAAKGQAEDVVLWVVAPGQAVAQAVLCRIPAEGKGQARLVCAATGCACQ